MLRKILFLTFKIFLLIFVECLVFQTLVILKFSLGYFSEEEKKKNQPVYLIPQKLKQHTRTLLISFSHFFFFIFLEKIVL